MNKIRCVTPSKACLFKSSKLNVIPEIKEKEAIFSFGAACFSLVDFVRVFQHYVNK